MELSSSSARCPFVKKEKIADGSFGSVFVYKKMGGELCAGKQIPKASLGRAVEDQILKDVGKHAENVVHYIGTYEDDTCKIFFMELCDATVHQYVANVVVTLYKRNQEEDKIKTKDYFHDITPLQICEQAAKGIEYLHKFDIIHRDVKSSNFLMVRTKDKTLVKVSDFGLSRQLPPDEHGVRTKSRGTRAFIAPECYEDVEQTKAIDIFSLGILIYYVLTDGCYPFGKKEFEQESNIRNKNSPNMQDLLNNEKYVHDVKKKKMSEETKITAGDLIKRMIKHTACDRFTIGDVLAHPFFWNSKKKVDFYIKLSKFMKHKESKDFNQHFRKLNESQGEVNCYEKLSKCDAGLKENGKDGDFKTLVINHSNLPKPITDDRRFKYDKTIKDLLRLIRNMHEHGNEKSDEIKKLLGMCGNEIDWETFLLTLTGSYPELLVHLYEFFRNSTVAVAYYQPERGNENRERTSIASFPSGNVAISSREISYYHKKNLSGDTLQANDNISTIDEKCKILQKKLKEAARLATETDDSTRLVGKQIERVALELVTGNNSQHLVHQSSHYHRREDFKKLYVTPKGDIRLEDLLPLSLKQAEEEAKSRCHSDVSKNHHIQIYGNVVGIIGEAGIGKTTLSKVLTQKILDGSLGQFKFDYVFYISVRHVNIKTKTTFPQFLVDNTSFDWFSEEWCKDIVNNNLLMKLKDNPKVIFIFDGLDEVEIIASNFDKVSLDPETEATSEDFMKNLLSGRLLPHAKKFIISRPGQLYDLHEACRPHFIATILGLSKEAQKKLCRQICEHNHADVLQFLEDHPDIFSYCYVPANCILTMAAFQNKEFTDSKTKQSLITMTGIMTYNVEEYTESLHLRLKSDSIGEELEKLCKLAWEGILNSKLIFNKSDTSNVGIDAATLSAFMSTYLSKELKSKLLPGAKRFYFSHLIWQEFFSAIHVMLFMSLDEFEKYGERFPESKWQKVLQFMFGVHNTLTYSHLENIFVGSEQSNKKWNALKKIALELVPSWKVDDGNDNNWKANEDATKQLFQLCVLVHEAQDKDLKNQIAAALPSNIILRGILLPSDVTSLDYVLSGRSTNLNMSLEDMEFVEESFKIFFDKMAANVSRHIQMPKVECCGQKIDDDSAKSLAACLSQIQELSLWECELSASVVEYISSGISKLEKQMELLNLGYNPIGDKGAEYLSSCLKNINQLNIHNCNITDAGVHHLSTAISKLSRPMELLKLSWNSIGDKGAKYLSSCLKNINQLHIDDCEITDAGVHHLSTAISKLSRPMELLHLNDNRIGDKGAEYLSSCLKNINQLDIARCNITDAGVHHLSMAILKLSRPTLKIGMGADTLQYGMTSKKHRMSAEPVKEDTEKSLSAGPVLSDMSSSSPQKNVNDDMQSKVLTWKDTSDSVKAKTRTDDLSTSLAQDNSIKIVQTTDSSKVTYSQVAEDYIPLQTTAIIGIRGGCVRLGRCLIDIPANAVTECVYFTFTLRYKNDTKEDDVHQLRLTPILECTPSCIFDKPVKITLPTCYAPANPGVLVTPKTYNGTNWIDLQSVACGEDYVISFNTDSFCLKGAWGRKTDFCIKRVFFKCCANIQDIDAIINWTIVDGDVEAIYENLLKEFYVDVKPEQNLILRMKCTNAEIEPACETKIRSKRLFRERTTIKRQFSIISINDPINWQEQYFDYEICDEATGEIIKSDEKFTMPTSCIPIEDLNEAIDTDLPVEEKALACASVDDYDKHKTNDKVYKILHQPKGRVLIISIINFLNWKGKKIIKRRKGGEKECADMKKLFEELGCDVKVEKDLSQKEVLSKAKQFSKLKCDTDFCILFMMSHGVHSTEGTDTFLLSKDRKEISVSKIMSYFQNGNTTEKLKGKPKILLFQCCRGQKNVEDVKFIPQHISFQETFEEKKNKPIEDMADILLGYATVDGRSATRGKFTSSIFKVFWENAKNEHFSDMLTMVKDKMYDEGQLSEHFSCFRKKLYLFPGITPPKIADSIQE